MFGYTFRLQPGTDRGSRGVPMEHGQATERAARTSLGGWAPARGFRREIAPCLASRGASAAPEASLGVARQRTLRIPEGAALWVSSGIPEVPLSRVRSRTSRLSCPAPSWTCPHGGCQREAPLGKAAKRKEFGAGHVGDTAPDNASSTKAKRLVSYGKDSGIWTRDKCRSEMVARVIGYRVVDVAQ
jgi:hypothetical protein